MTETEYAFICVLREGYQFDRLAIVVEFEQDLVESAVGRDVKVAGSEVFFNSGPDVFGGLLHHGTEDALLRTSGVGEGTGRSVIPGLHDLQAG